MFTTLTPREKEVLRLVSQGYSNKEISKTIHVSLHTVATHLNQIYEKTGLKHSCGSQSATRVKLVLEYLKTITD